MRIATIEKINQVFFGARETRGADLSTKACGNECGTGAQRGCSPNSGQRKARDGGAGLRIHTWEQLYNDAAAVKTL
jgi:hypothetical protein